MARDVQQQITQILLEPAVLTAQLTKVQDVTCNGDADGSISVVGAGGTAAEIIVIYGTMRTGQTTATAVWISTRELYGND